MRLETFDMIDRIAALDRAAGRLTANARVPGESPVFEGHFPGRPLMPGVLLTETMAQASGYLLLALNGFARMPFLAGVEKARFRAFVEPRAELTIEAVLAHEGSGYAVTQASIASGGRRVCDAELMLRLMDVPDEFRAAISARAGRIGLMPESTR